MSKSKQKQEPAKKPAGAPRQPTGHKRSVRRGHLGRKQPGAIDYAAIEHALIHGEIRQVGDNRVLSYPSLRELARRHGVDNALLCRWAKKRNIKFLRGLAEAARQGVQEAVAPSEPPNVAAAVAAAREARRERAQVMPGITPVPAAVEAERAARPIPEPEPGKVGRPDSRRAPRYSVEELDRLLVFGEPAAMPDGTVSVYYPTRQEIAERLRISTSTIAAHWKKHACERRRAEARAKIMARVEARLVEETAGRISMSLEESIETIDEFLARFRASMRDGQVRTDLPADYDRMQRLKQLLTGNVEHRAEVQQTFSLELAQRQHAEVLRDLEQASSAELGMVIDTTAVEVLAEGGAGAGEKRALVVTGAHADRVSIAAAEEDL